MRPPLYRAEGCRRAELDLGQHPGSIDPLVHACAASYCARLPEPKPEACRGAVSASSWIELSNAILRFEHGAAAEPIIRLTTTQSPRGEAR